MLCIKSSLLFRSVGILNLKLYINIAYLIEKCLHFIKNSFFWRALLVVTNFFKTVGKAKVHIEHLNFEDAVLTVLMYDLETVSWPVWTELEYISAADRTQSKANKKALLICYIRKRKDVRINLQLWPWFYRMWSNQGKVFGVDWFHQDIAVSS